MKFQIRTYRRNQIIRKEVNGQDGNLLWIILVENGDRSACRVRDAN